MATVWDVIVSEAQRLGVDTGILSPIILMESGGDPNASNSAGYVGLLAMNPYSGQGTGHTTQQLKDPKTELDIGLPYIHDAEREALKQGLAPTDVRFLNYVLSHSGHTSMTGQGQDPNATMVADVYFNAPDHGVNTLKQRTQRIPANEKDAQQTTGGRGTNPLQDAGNVAGQVGNWIGANNPLQMDSNPFAFNLGIDGLDTAIANGLKDPIIQLRSFLFDHAAETVLMIVAILLLLSSVLHVYEGKIS